MPTIPHIRLVAAGTLGDGSNEIWSNSLKLLITRAGDPISPVQADLDMVATRVTPIWAGFITSAVLASPDGCLFSSWVRLAYCKASAVLATGKDDPATNAKIVEAPIGTKGIGTAGPGADTENYEQPYAVALALTLTGSQYGRGSAAFGRFYLPGPNLHYSENPDVKQHMVDGLINETVATAYATQGAKLLHDINASLVDMNGHSGMVVNIGSSASAAGLRWQRVSHVSCDNRPDTIRRRQNAISGQGRQTATV